MAGEHEFNRATNAWSQLVKIDNNGQQRVRNDNIENCPELLAELITNLESLLQVDDLQAKLPSMVFFPIVLDVLNEKFREEFLVYPHAIGKGYISTAENTFPPCLLNFVGKAVAALAKLKKIYPAKHPNSAEILVNLKDHSTVLKQSFKYFADVYDNPILAAKFYFKFRAQNSKEESLGQDFDYTRRHGHWQRVLAYLNKSEDEVTNKAIVGFLQTAIDTYKGKLDLSHRYADILRDVKRILEDQNNGRARLQRAIAFTQHLETELADSWLMPLSNLDPETTAAFCLKGLGEQTRARAADIEDFELDYDDLLINFRPHFLLPNNQGVRSYPILSADINLNVLRASTKLSDRLKLAIIYDKGYKDGKVKIARNTQAAYRVLNIVKAQYEKKERELPFWLNSFMGRLLLELGKKHEGENLLYACLDKQDPNALYHWGHIHLDEAKNVRLNPASWQERRDIAKECFLQAMRYGHPLALLVLIEQELLEPQEMFDCLRLATTNAYEFYQIVNHGPHYVGLFNSDADLNNAEISAGVLPLVRSGSKVALGVYQKIAKAAWVDLDEEHEKKLQMALTLGWAFDTESHVSAVKKCLSVIYLNNVFLRAMIMANGHKSPNVKEYWQKRCMLFPELFSLPLSPEKFHPMKESLKHQSHVYEGQERTAGFAKILTELNEFLENEDNLVKLQQQWQLANSLRQLWGNNDDEPITNSKDFIDATVKALRIQQEMVINQWDVEITPESYANIYSTFNRPFNLGASPQGIIRELAKTDTFSAQWKLIHIYLRGYSYDCDGKPVKVLPDFPKAQARLNALNKLIEQRDITDNLLETIKQYIARLLKITTEELNDKEMITSVAYRNEWLMEGMVLIEKIRVLSRSLNYCEEKSKVIIDEAEFNCIQELHYIGEDNWVLNRVKNSATYKLQTLLATNPFLQLSLLIYQSRVFMNKDKNTQLHYFWELKRLITENDCDKVIENVTQYCKKSKEPFLKHWQEILKQLTTGEKDLSWLSANKETSDYLFRGLLGAQIEAYEEEDLITPANISNYVIPLLFKKPDGSDFYDAKLQVYMGMALEDLDRKANAINLIREDGVQGISLVEIWNTLSVYKEHLPWLKEQLGAWTTNDEKNEKENGSLLKNKLGASLNQVTPLASFQEKTPPGMSDELRRAYLSFVKGIISYLDQVSPAPKNSPCCIM